MAKDIQRYLSGDAVEACPPTLGYRLRKAYRKNRATVRVGIAFAMLLLAGIVSAAGLAIKATNAERIAAWDRDAVIESRESAEREKINALSARDELRTALYASDIQMAVSAWGSHDPVVRRRRLTLGCEIEPW